MRDVVKPLSWKDHCVEVISSVGVPVEIIPDRSFLTSEPASTSVRGKSVRTSPASRGAPDKPAWPRSTRCQSRPNDSGGLVTGGSSVQPCRVSSSVTPAACSAQFTTVGESHLQRRPVNSSNPRPCLSSQVPWSNSFRTPLFCRRQPASLRPADWTASKSPWSACRRAQDDR